MWTLPPRYRFLTVQRLRLNLRSPRPHRTQQQPTPLVPPKVRRRKRALLQRPFLIVKFIREKRRNETNVYVHRNFVLASPC